LQEFKEMNEEYKKKYGYIFIVCATGKSADEMLTLLKKRLINNPANEIRIAAEEQNKITHLRLDKLFS
jgi:2-oxo-4-hydroxy-4-carboxy-5-ureidoimidazoline decarboxylase